MSHFTVSGSGHLTCTSTGSFTVQEPSVEGLVGGGSGGGLGGGSEGGLISVLPEGDVFTFYFTNEGGGFVNFYLNGGQGWDNSDYLSHLTGGGTITMRFKDANDNVISNVGDITFITAAELAATGSSQTIEDRLDIVFQHYIRLPFSSVPNTAYISTWNHSYSSTDDLKAAMIVTTNKIEVIKH